MTNVLSLEEIKKQIENLATQDILLMLGMGIILLYILLTKTKRGRAVTKKFRNFPNLITIEEDYETEVKKPKNLDENTKFHMQLVVNTARGYLLAQKNKSDETPHGIIDI